MAEKPAIPLDIIETIINILATIDDRRYSSVKACSLTCRSVVHFCRKHIFAHVTLDYPVPLPIFPLPSYRFQQLLKTAPEIVDYVRDFTFKFTSHLTSGYIVRESGDEIILELSKTLKKFTKIQNLTMEGHWNVRLDWRSVPHCLEDALFYLLDLPTIDYLALLHIANFPILQLTRCVNLRRLRTEYFSTPFFDPIFPTRHHRSVMLDEFYSTGSQSSYDMIEILKAKGLNGLPFIDFRNLKKYSVTLSHRDDIDVSQWILKTTNHLVTFDLEVGIDVHNLSSFAEIVCPSIKSLKTIILRFSTEGSKLYPLAGFPQQLKLMREKRNVLEELEIHIRLPRCNTNDDWGNFDDVFDDFRWTSLKTISIQIQTRLVDMNFENSVQIFREQFPNLSSSKDITFNLTVDNFKVPIRTDK